jgi:excisionase family DNA binding protein
MGRTLKPRRKGDRPMLPAEQPVDVRYVAYRGAERITGLSRWTLARHVEAGRLRAYRVGTAVRFKVTDLVEFVEGHEAK